MSVQRSFRPFLRRRNLFVVLRALVALLVVAVGGGGGHDLLAEPLWSKHDGAGDDIVVAAGEVDARQVQVIDAESGERRVVTSGPAYDQPVWSPDGTKIAFVGVAEDQERTQLFVVGSNGTQRRQLTDFAEDSVSEPAWSPDGRHLVFARANDDGLAGLSVIRVEGTALRTLTDGAAARDSQPSWSPLGGQIAFVRLNDGGGQQVMVVDVDGSGLRTVTAPEVFASVVEWSPDGQLLAYGDVSGPMPVVVAVAPDGSGRRQLPGTGVRPSWSPDGAEVAYSGFFDDESVDGRPLYAAGADGSGFRQIAVIDGDNATAQNPIDWSPDALEIVYHDNTNVFSVAAAGGDPQVLTQAGLAVSDPGYGPGIAERRAGPSRVETAVEVSASRFESAHAVVVAGAHDYADALGGGPVAALLGGPLLLTGQDRLHDAAADEIIRLSATRVVLMGGQAALSDQVERDLQAIGVTDVVRLAGANRFDTARLAAEFLGAERVYVAEGNVGWPDAVAVSGLAAFQQRPILLTERTRLPAETRQALEALSASEAVIVGGRAVVSDDVTTQLESEGPAVSRLAGTNRYETSRAVTDQAVAAGMSPASTWLAGGGNWPDSLSAGPAAAHDAGVVLLVDGDNPDASSATRDWLVDHGAELDRVTLVGGPDVLSPATAVLVQRAHD